MLRESLKKDSQKPKLEDYTLFREIGRGSYSEVVLVKHNLTKQEFALKIIKKKQIQRERKNHEVFIERLILQKVQSESFIKLLGSF